jgi:hypothetical protein
MILNDVWKKEALRSCIRALLDEDNKLPVIGVIDPSNIKPECDGERWPILKVNDDLWLICRY